MEFSHFNEVVFFHENENCSKGLLIIEFQSGWEPRDVPSNYASHKKRLNGSERSPRDLSKVSGENSLRDKRIFTLI